MKSIRLQQDLRVGQTQIKLLSDRLERVIEQKMEAAGIRAAACTWSQRHHGAHHAVAADTTALRRCRPRISRRACAAPVAASCCLPTAGTLDWHLNPRQRPASALKRLAQARRRKC
jgi:hypothetical protein